MKSDLRKLAEAKAARSPDIPESLSPDETRDTLHELQVHQIELEMQNEELRRAQAEIEAGLARYFDLYDLAPVGYCTLSEQGLILETNLTAATLLGTARSTLIKQPFSRFIIKDDQNLYYLHRKKLFETGEKQQCELRLAKPDGAVFWAQLTATAAQAEDGVPACRVMLSDVTERKQAEEALAASEGYLKKIFDSLPIGLWFADKNGKLLRGNPAGISIWGAEPHVDPSEYGVFKARRWPSGEEITPDDWALTHTIRDGASILNEMLEIDAFDGRKKIILNFTAPVLDENGGIQGAIVLNQDVTDHMRAVEALKRSEDLLSQTEHIGRVGGWSFNIDTMAQAWTDEVYRIHEIEISPNPTVEAGINYYTKASRPIIEKAVQRAIELGEEFDLELEIITAKGNNRAVHTIGKADLNNRRIYGFFQDITERKQAEEALRASEDKFRSIFASMTEIVVLHELVCDEDGRPVNYRILDCNPAFTQITGIRHDDAVGRLATHVYGSDTAPYLDEYARVVLTGEPCAFITSYAPINKHFDIHAASPGKNLFITVTTDITERKRAEEALKASEMRFKELLLKVPTVAVQGYALDGTVRYWNRASETFYGYTAEEALNRDLLDLIIPSAMRDGVRAAIRQMVETGETVPASELELIRKDGSLIPVYSSHALVQLPGQEPELFCIDIDITELKQTKAEQAKLQEQFFQAQKMESVGRLAGGVAHDFNNLLMGIMGYAELCREELASEHPIQEWLAEIMAETNRSADLVRQLLAFARKQIVQPKALDLNEQIGGMLKMLRRLIGERISLTWSPAASPRIVTADPSHIDQVIANLCVNAADAITGSGRIAIATRNVTMDETDCSELPGMTPGTYMLVTVADSGCGMTADTLAHAFEPFFTTKGVGRGTGLGLATVYGIVKQSNGFIQVDSVPGAGTTFSIYLPTLACSERATVPVADAEPTPGGDETILVVDDERSIRITTAAHLERLGYTVLMADGPETALQLARAHVGAIHLLLSDMVMPGMSGVELQASLLAERPNVKTILITGYAAADFFEPEERRAKTVRLTKPVPFKDLARAIRSALGDQHAEKT